MLSGAAPLGAPLVRAFREKLAARGGAVAVLQGPFPRPSPFVFAALMQAAGYGLTETSPSMMTLPRAGAERKVGAAGTLMANFEVRLVDDDGVDAPEGGPGEIWARGPAVMKVRGRRLPARATAKGRC